MISEYDLLSNPQTYQRGSGRRHGRPEHLGGQERMERGVFIGGALIAASLLIAVLLNSKSHPEPKPAPAVETTAPTTDETTKSAVDQLSAPMRVSSHVTMDARDPAAQPQPK